MQSFKEFFNNDIVQEATGIVNWTLPMINMDMPEITKSAQKIGVEIKQLQAALKNAKLIDLPDQFWKTLKNPNVSQTASQISKDANKPQMGKNSPAPIVLMKDNQTYVIGGNSRLMAAKAVNIKPKVLAVMM
jgi:hypothetical protein